MRNVWVLAILLAGCSPSGSNDWQTPAHQAVIQALEVEDGDKVKDAIWTSMGILKVGVLSNGSRQDGFAQYICAVVAEHGFKDTWVQVVDIVKLQRDGDWTAIGEAHCDKFQ